MSAPPFHLKFGNSNIASVDGNKLTIDFDKAGQKRVLDGFVERCQAAIRQPYARLPGQDRQADLQMPSMQGILVIHRSFWSERFDLGAWRLPIAGRQGRMGPGGPAANARNASIRR